MSDDVTHELNESPLWRLAALLSAQENVDREAVEVGDCKNKHARDASRASSCLCSFFFSFSLRKL
jgi:hypothetical protein